MSVRRGGVVPDSWPDAGEALLDELRASPGRVALVLNDAGADDGIDAMARLQDAPVTSVGRLLTESEPLRSLTEVRRALSQASILTDLDILFWQPWLQIDVVGLLSGLARRRPIVAAWPGHISGGQATYSRPGRRDFYQTALRDVIVLRPRARRFPDQIPFDVEHIPA